jgi:hypothetical protein
MYLHVVFFFFLIFGLWFVYFLTFNIFCLFVEREG